MSLFTNAAKVCVAKAEWILQGVTQEALEAYIRQSDKLHCKHPRDNDAFTLAVDGCL